MKKNLLLIIVALYAHGANGYTNSTKQIVAISIPKCGTYLLAKCIRNITGRVGIRRGPEDLKNNRRFISNGSDFTATPKDFDYLTSLPTTKFYFPHLLPLPEYIERLTDGKKYALFFIYRDPRDETISLMHHIRRKRQEHNDLWKESVDAISDDELLTSLIKGCKWHATDDEHNTHVLTSDVNTRYRTYLPWLTVPGVYEIRFEDLIGESGGGSAKVQLQTIRNMARHMGISLRDDAVKKIVASLFGDSPTFHKGQIGSWKTEFTEEHKALFKEIAGQLLIDLGYEKDLNW